MQTVFKRSLKATYDTKKSEYLSVAIKILYNIRKKMIEKKCIRIKI